MERYDWTTLFSSTEDAIEWSAVTAAPSRGEQLAARMFRLSRQRAHPWWLLMAPWAAILVLNAFEAWGNADVRTAALLLVLVAFVALQGWQAQGFFDLLTRYHEELRHRNDGTPAPAQPAG